ncbi:Enhancer of mRNA-decapping protein 4-like protein [Frankliniella fusca]|uniref:Enhancer of mRNA-decapping protein 4-like protein n=1 Tax=Frankliniella fusca TaxID=407009 RepID=A0AAE1LDY8_9NEOP|nr:Enhancer of mRNA-decapping protein 4-like protein [Frankliniella fusca]
MTDALGVIMGKCSESEEVSQLRARLEENVNLISRQSQEIATLKSELKEVLSERDMLLCEVSRLKFEMEMADLKRLHEGRHCNEYGSKLLRFYVFF